MKIITNYGETRIEAQSWAEATFAIARLQAEEAHHASLADYREEMPELNFSQEELSA
jgi:hypothetical protein